MNVVHRSAAPGWQARAACAWALLFAAQSFYGAAGGLFGIETFGHTIEREARQRDREFVAVVWTTGALKLLAACLAAGLLVDRLGRWAATWLRLAALVGGGFCILYGLANCVQHALMLSGAIDVPDGLGRTAAWWHLLLWDPWWTLGGALLVLAALAQRRRLSSSRGVGA